MNKGKFIAALAVSAMFISLIACGPIKPANAQSAKIIVVPDDYSSISWAIGNATSGDTILVRAGTYHESMWVLNKTVTIRGEGAGNTQVAFQPPTIYFPGAGPASGGRWGPDCPVKVFAANALIAGFTFTTTGGQFFANASWVTLSDNVFADGFDWIAVVGDHDIVTHNSFTFGSNKTALAGIDMPRTALWLDGSKNAVVASNTVIGSISYPRSSRIINNTIFGFIDAVNGNFIYGNTIIGGNTFSCGIKTGNGSIVAYNTIKDCTGPEIANLSWANAAGGAITITVQGVHDGNCIIYGNTIINNNAAGILYQSSANNLIYGNYIANNTVALQTTAFLGNSTWYCNDFVNNGRVGIVTTYPQYGYVDNWDSNGHGNYWSSYNGTDANQDGIGDTPYQLGTNQADNYPLMTPFNLSTANVQQPAWANPTIPDAIPPWTAQMGLMTLSASTTSGSSVTLRIAGNVTSSQISNVAISADQSAARTTLSFTEKGATGTTGFCNVSIPKTAVPYGNTPTIYIDNQPVQTQGYTQDVNNYYVWSSIHFSTHQTSIVFSAPLPSQNPTSTANSKPADLSQLIIYAIDVVFVVTIAAVVLVIRRREENKS